MAVKPQNHQDYLDVLPEEARRTLQSLRETIQQAAPGAEEVISYQLPAYRLDGKMLVAYGATARHCALYLMSSTTVEAHRKALKEYDTSKGTIRFQAHTPLPPDLVRRLVKARIAENAG